MSKTVTLKDEVIDNPKQGKELGDVLANKSINIKSLKNEKNLMLFPFCSTSKATRYKSIKYRSTDNKFSLDVTANHEYGMAKIWDFDILRFVFSKIDAIAAQTGYHPSSVSFSAYECLKFLKRSPNAGKNIKWLKEALDRLASTTYKGNIFKDDLKLVSGFTLISYEYIESGKSLDKISVTLDKRIVSSMRNSESLMNIDSRLIEEPSGLKKRLLELVYLKIKNQKKWVVSVGELQELCANSWKLKRFKCEIKSLKDLDWHISEISMEDSAYIVFTKKNDTHVSF